jgi:hypothetical protein
MARAVSTASLDPDTVREALEHIAQGLRPADLDELRATLGPNEDPFWALFESYENSAATWLILDRTSLPIGIFGVAAHAVPQLGIAWLMGTEGMEREALSIARQTPGYVAKLHDYFPILWANVDARNALSMKWLEWAGFTINDANPAFGPEERLFLEYARTA